MTGPGHSPQPMSASRGGPWNQLLRLLRVVRWAARKQNRVWTAQVEPALPPPTGRRTGAGTRTRTDPRGAGELRPQPRSPPRTRSSHHLRGTHEGTRSKEFGVSGAGKSRVRGGLLCLGNVFSSSNYLDPVPGRRLQVDLVTQPTAAPLHPAPASPSSLTSLLIPLGRQLALAQPD